MGGGGVAPGGLLSPDALGHQVAVLTVTAHNSALRPDSPDQFKGRSVGYPQIVIGKIDLIGSHAGSRHVPQFGPDTGIPIFDGHMKAVMTRGTPVSPTVPSLQGRGEGAAALRFGKVQYGGGAPCQGGQRTGVPVVCRLVGEALVHLKVGMGVDKAGEYQLARSVYDPAVPAGERDANLCNPIPGYPQIGPDWAVGAEKGTVLNQNRHSRPLRWSREQPEWPV